MKHYTLNISLSGPIGNIFRKRHVLIVLENAQGSILLGEKKHFYPEGIYRFIGGGVNEDESPMQAAVREIKEEINIEVIGPELNAFAEVVINAIISDETYTLTTYMYHYKIKDGVQLNPSDDISGLKELDINQLPELVNKYENLSGTYSAINNENVEYKHSWQDYGRMYAPIHQIAYEWLINRS
jgi:8-oxo-dGTP pyrophosphatase MutT (NUDIX family)